MSAVVSAPQPDWVTCGLQLWLMSDPFEGDEESQKTAELMLAGLTPELYGRFDSLARDGHAEETGVTITQYFKKDVFRVLRHRQALAEKERESVKGRDLEPFDQLHSEIEDRALTSAVDAWLKRLVSSPRGGKRV